MVEGKKREVIFKDIRRYKCEFCGICRSKKSLLSSHLLSYHQEEIKEKEISEMGENKDRGNGQNTNTCQECGVSFKKPAYLRQHMQSHSLERLFSCPVDDCSSSYRRKDHLTRHLLQHQGKVFECPNDTCKQRFSFQGNMTRHVKEFHEGPSSSLEETPHVKELHEGLSSGLDEMPHVKEFHEGPSSSLDEQSKKHVCPESGCGKVFKFASKLRKHEDSHVKLKTAEAFCSDPICMKYFTNEKCLREHVQECHRHIICDICGTRQLKKNIKRHLRTHDDAVESSKEIKCSFDGCLHVFSNNSSLNQHVKAVHMELKPFKCCYSGCGMTFAYKHVRDHHEKSGCHVYYNGDFVESDEQFRSRPRGGRKRKCPPIESLLRKRVVPLDGSDLLFSHGFEYLSNMLADG